VQGTGLGLWWGHVDVLLDWERIGRIEGCAWVRSEMRSRVLALVLWVCIMCGEYKQVCDVAKCCSVR
jgi:hypothetical protein